MDNKLRTSLNKRRQMDNQLHSAAQPPSCTISAVLDFSIGLTAAHVADLGHGELARRAALVAIALQCAMREQFPGATLRIETRDDLDQRHGSNTWTTALFMSALSSEMDKLGAAVSPSQCGFSTGDHPAQSQTAASSQSV